MKLKMILFALVCLGLLALALAHDGECPHPTHQGCSSAMLNNTKHLASAWKGVDHSKNENQDHDWDWEVDKDQDCQKDDDDKELGQCYWKCVKVCHKKDHTTSTTRKHTTSTTKDCPKETTSTRKHTTTTEECPKETTSTTRKHTTSTTKDCPKETTSTTRKHC
jgi:hypothetical protein